MSYIYKITNNITNKLYIGYTSRSLQRRLYEHFYEAEHTKSNTKLNLSIRKYGKDNFTIESIYEFDEKEEDWRELEKYYISLYNTYKGKGYNSTEGGDLPPISYGDANNKTKIKECQYYELVEDLKNLEMSYKDIGKKYNISVSQLYCINSGTSLHHEDVEYPIRIYNKFEEQALQIIHLLSTSIELSNQQIADSVDGYFRANEVASINNGKKYAYLWKGDFPIRKVVVPNNYQEKQQIAKDILEYISLQKAQNKKVTQIQIQRDLKYGRSIVEKTIKGIYPYKVEGYNYPIRL